MSDIHQAGVDTNVAPAVYYPLAQFPQTTLTHAIVVRTTGDPSALSTAVRDRKVEAIRAAGGVAPVVASANPGCTMHLRAVGLDVRHPATLLREAIEPRAGHGG